jgi:PadR family transcriptional regulator AphA
MRRNLHYFWPRAESNLYAEPKRLVEAGFAKARPEPVGRRGLHKDRSILGCLGDR